MELYPPETPPAPRKLRAGDLLCFPCGAPRKPFIVSKNDKLVLEFSDIPCIKKSGKDTGWNNSAFSMEGSRLQAGQRAYSTSLLVDGAPGGGEETAKLRQELAKAREHIAVLQQREATLRARLSENAARQFERQAVDFEDLSLGENRPSRLVQRYGSLYSQSRIDALDALDDLPELADCDDLKVKLLFSILVLAVRSCEHALWHIKNSIRRLLCMPDGFDGAACLDSASKGVEDAVTVYLKKTVADYNLTRIYEEVSSQVWATLYDYPALATCDSLVTFIRDCVQLAWPLVVQTPPFYVDYDPCSTFDPSRHSRFHLSDPDSDEIKAVLWPALHEGHKGPCIFKAIVVT